MRLVIAAASVLIVSVVSAEPPQTLGSRLAALSAKNPVVRWVGRVFVECVDAEARKLAEKPEPALTDADWRPSHARPTVEQEVASAMAACAFEGEGLALEVSAVAMREIRASIEAEAADTIRWEREARNRLRRE